MESTKLSLGRLRKILDLYQKQAEKFPDQVSELMSTASSLLVAIQIACTSEDLNGKRMSHQYRIPAQVLAEWMEAVISMQPAISKTKTFDELHENLTSVSDTIKGVGVLLTYDTADKIGTYRKLPKEKLYLHAGTRKGAEMLLGKRLGLTLEINKLPSILQKMSIENLENLFCICKLLLDPIITDQEFQRRCRDFENRFLKVRIC